MASAPFLLPIGVPRGQVQYWRRLSGFLDVSSAHSVLRPGRTSAKDIREVF